MPRQPYLSFNPAPAQIDVGVRTLGSRPALEAKIAHCLMSWPHVEAEMAVLLGQILGAKSDAALAVFQALRRSSSQRDSISEAAEVSLDYRDFELVSAVLNVHRATEAQRNALCHGHFGNSTARPDDLIWISTQDYVRLKVDHAVVRREWTLAKQHELHTVLFVYRLKDLEMVHRDIKELGEIWFDLINYLADAGDSHRHDELYRRLCDRPRIAQELATLRRGKNLPIRP